MAEKFSNYIEANAIPTKRILHDCVDTGNDLVLSSGIEVDLPVDCGARDYKSTTTELWNPATSLIKDTIDDSEIRVKIKMVLNGAVNSICTIKCIVPHPTFGDILIDQQDIVLYKNNIDVDTTRFFMLYNGTDSEAKTYGFKFTITPTAEMTLKSRSILASV